MSIISVWVGYGTFLLIRKVLPKNKSSVAIAASIAAAVSVPAAAFGFWIQYVIGATGTFSNSAVFTSMISVHVLIGIGEAIITGLTVTAVLASRSDLVFGWKNNKNKEVLEIKNV
jgi:ABC-type Co2+ transport system permease subunit